ncbi:MAG: T9SS type A sorting domain-containing protein [Bacteroidota bacterium]
MKKLCMLCLLLFVCIYGQSQEGEFRATIVNDPQNPTPPILVPGTPINLRLNIQGGRPNNCDQIPFGYTSAQSHLSFRLNFYAVDVNTQEEYFLHTQKFTFLVPDGQLYWTSDPVTSTFTVHPCIPTGDYTLKARIVSLTQYDGCGSAPGDEDYSPYSLSSSDVYLGATDVTDNQLYWCTFMGEDIYRDELCNDPVQNVMGSAVDCSLYNILAFHVDNVNAGSIAASINVITHECPTFFDLEAVVSGGTPAFHYQWFLGTGDFSTVSVNGTYYNNVIVTDAQGCMVMAEVDLGQYSYMDYPHGVTISSNNQSLADLNQDGIIRIKGAIKVAQNVNYSIDNTDFSAIQFVDAFDWEDDARFYTKSGIWLAQKSSLEINNMLLTDVPSCHNMWQGIQVLGHATNRQLGAKLILNNTTIEHAHVAVNSGDVTSRRNMQPNNFVLNGIVEATNTTFKNNNISINFSDSHGESTSSFVQKCNFMCDAPLIDVAKYHGKGSSIFINLINTRSLPIKASTFTGSLLFTEEARGTGIRSYNSNYRVTSGFVSAVLTPNVFDNLSKGIDIYSSGSLTDVVQIKDNRFSGTMQGITANNSNFDEISYNTFEIPEGRANYHSWGINLQACSGFMITENNFIAWPSNDFSYTYGNISRNISLTLGEVYKNQYQGRFNVATQAEQKNTLLSMKCNKYVDDSNFDWAVTSGILATQGTFSTTVTTLPAGNEFATCNTSDASQIFKATSVPTFIYNTHSNIIPICYSGGVTITDCQMPKTGASCPAQADLPSGFVLHGNGNANGPGNGNGSNNGLSNAEYNRLKAKKIRQDLRDGNLNGVLGLIVNSTDQSDLKLLVPTYLALGDCVKARQKLNQIDRTNTEGNEFYQLHDVLVNACASGRKLKELNTQEITQIENMEHNSNTRVKNNAEAVLAYKNEKQYLRFAEGLASSSAIGQDQVINEINQKQSSFEIYPNPSEGEIKLQMQAGFFGNITICDILGRVYVNENLEENNSFLAELEAGHYIVRFTDLNGKTESKQLFIKK